MDAETIRQLVGSFISVGILVLIGLIVRWALVARKDVPRLIALLPSDVQKILNDAAKYASEFIEQMDIHGELKAKGEEKLNLAVDYAVQYIEGVFKSNGFEINIDENEIKKAIQKYVWENPQLFPSDNSNTATLAGENSGRNNT